MIKHYLKIAIRNLVRQKGLTLINILGLSVGLGCFMLFMLYGTYEFNYDSFHKNGDNIYIVYEWDKQAKQEQIYQPAPLGPAMKQDLPDVLNFVQWDGAFRESLVKTEDKAFRMNVAFGDTAFFNVLTFPLKYGNASGALKGMRDIVLTESTAKKIYGNENPIGKTLQIKGEGRFELFTVSGVCGDPPPNSSVKFEILSNISSALESEIGKQENARNNWHSYFCSTFIQLRPGSSLPDDSVSLQKFYDRYHADDIAQLKKDGKWTGESPVTYRLLPIRGLHTSPMSLSVLHDDSVKPENIWILIALAAGVLLIACINFTTLAIGRSASRAKEVGIRKVVGSSKKNLVIQFLTEAIFLSAISVIFGLVLAQLFLPWFNQISGSTLTFSFGQLPKMIWMLIPLTFIVGIVAGSYPALVLSAFNPVEVLKNKVRLGGSNLFTKSLVTFQFVLSIGLIISTFIVLQQLHFLRTKDPGFNKENVVVVEATDMDIKKIYPLYRQAILAHPEIKSTASSELGLGEGAGRASVRTGHNGKDLILVEYNVDADYLPLMDISLIAGRNFDKNISGDTVRSVIINRTLMNNLGWTLQNTIGQPLTFYYRPDSINRPVVIGVIKDFHFGSFREEDQPQMFMQFKRFAPTPMPFEYRKFFIRIQSGEPSKALAILEDEWKKIVPDFPFKYSFLDEDIDRYYQSDIRLASILSWAGGISVFLACLGLFGLASLAAVNRTKEIGIRKVVGASVSRIVWLISADFVRLVIIALLIAAPIAWYYMNQWLQDFVYRITISWWVFVFCGIIAVLVSVLTISIHAIKAAIANPVKSLRTE